MWPLSSDVCMPTCGQLFFDKARERESGVEVVFAARGGALLRILDYSRVIILSIQWNFIKYWCLHGVLAPAQKDVSPNWSCT